MEAVYVLAGCALYVGGVYTGIYIARSFTVEREVVRQVPVDRVVTVEKPVVVQQAAKNGGSLVSMGNANRRHVLTDPNEREAAERVQTLLNDLAE